MSLSRFPEMLELGEAERMQLAQDLWDSIPAGSTAPVIEEEYLHEVERRLAEHHAAPDTSMPWDEARAALRDRLGAWGRIGGDGRMLPVSRCRV